MSTRTHKVAVVLGVTEYTNEQHGILTFVKDMLKKVKKRLDNSGWKYLEVLSDSKSNADKNGLLESFQKKLNSVLNDCKLEETMVFFYYVGHGLVVDRESAMVTSNGDVIPWSEVFSDERLGKIKWSIFILDACRSRLASSISQEMATEISWKKGPHSLVLRSCGYHEEAYDGKLSEELCETWDTNRSIYDILHDVSNKCEGKAELTKNGKDNPFQVFSFKYKLDHKYFIPELSLEGKKKMVGRAKEKESLKDSLRNYRLGFITGGPGEGKSLLAETVSTELKDANECKGGGYHINMRERKGKNVEEFIIEVLGAQLRQTGCLLEQDGKKELGWEEIERAFRCMESNQHVLIYYDNADDVFDKPSGDKKKSFMEILKHLKTLSSPSQIRQLVATRNKGVAGTISLVEERRIQVILLNGLDEKDALKLFKQQFDDEKSINAIESELKKIIELTHKNPWMIKAIAAIMNTRDLSGKEIIECSRPLDRRGRRNENSEENVFVEELKLWWKTILSRFLKDGKLLQGLERLSVFPGSFDEDGFKAVVQDLLDEGCGGMKDILVDLQELTVVSKYVSKTTGERRYSLHALHRQTAAELLIEQEKEVQVQASRGFVTHMLGLKEKLSGNSIKHRAAVFQDELLNLMHLPEILKESKLLDCQAALENGEIDVTKIAITLDELALQLLDMRILAATSEKIYLIITKTLAAVLGPEHPGTLTARNNLAVTLNSQGKYEEAEAIYQRVLEARERVLGPEHPNTLDTRNNLASTTFEQGKYREAEAIYQRVLEARERVLGPEHPDTLAACSNIVLTLENQGKYKEAEELYQQVLQNMECVLGSEHSITLRIQNSLANTILKQGKYREAEAMYKNVFEAQERVLGPENPDTLNTGTNLASAMDKQGKYADAEKKYQAVLEGLESVLGPEHPDTLATRGNLALVLTHQGKYTKAEKMYRQVLEARERVLGPEHPSTLGSTANIAMVLREQGKYNDAEPIYRQVLQAQDRVLGSEDPDTLLTRNNLAVTLDSQGKYEEAEAIYQRVLEARERVLGPEHPDTLLTRNNLAVTLDSQGKYEEAEATYKSILEVQVQKLGPEHPNALLTRNNLAWALYSQGKQEEAEGIYHKVLEAQDRVLGPEHPNTLLTRNNLALALHSQGKYEEAVAMYKQVFEARERVLGPEHPDTVSTHQRLALTLNSQGKHTEAEAIFRKVLAARKRVLVPDHPDTFGTLNTLASSLVSQGKHADAEGIYKTVLDGLQRVLGPEHSITLLTRNNLALAFKNQGKYAEAEAIYRKVLEVQERVLGPEHPDTLQTKRAIGNM